MYVLHVFLTMAKSRSKRVREPVQVYLDSADGDLLRALAEKTGLSKAELLRRGLRQLAAGELTEKAPGWSLQALPGLIDGGPTDLAARHDDYLAAVLEEKKGAGARAR